MKTLFAALVLAVAIPAAPLAAHACGMEETYIPSQPAQLYVFSLEEIENGSYGTALTAARRLVKHGKATDEQKAKGHAVIAWIRWANGLQKQSRQSIEESKKLDPNALASVLDKIKAGDKKVTADLRAEAENVAVAVK